MKKSLAIVAVAALSLLCSCTRKDRLPENPRDGQEYVDRDGNHWFYNYALMRWAMTPNGGMGASYYYYPHSNSWTDTQGKSVSTPKTVKSVSYKPNSTLSRSSSTSKSSKPASSSRSFGSSSRSSVS